MNARALTLFFWLTLIGTATVVGNDHESHVKLTADGSADRLEWRSDDFDLDPECLEATLANTRPDKHATRLTELR